MLNQENDKRKIFVESRFVQWRAFMIRRSKRWRGVRDDKEQLELVEFQPGTIYKYYYTLEESDPGVMMETNLATKEVIEMEIMNLHVFLRMMEKAIMETNKFERFLYLQLFVISFLTCVEQFQIKIITKLLNYANKETTKFKWILKL